MKYRQRKDCEGWEIKSGQPFRLACCDCGLVHDVVVVREGKSLGIAAKRNARATAARRRKHKQSPPISES